MALVDHAWREASQSPQLYAHHLSKCPSYTSPAIDLGPLTDEDLPRLKKQFAREVKRNLFESFLQPKRTTINLISSTTSSAAAFPRGEAFDFYFSPSGHWTLALSSSRIYIIDTASPTISVKRELKVIRRPIAASITDDGMSLTVLSSRHVSLYDLAYEKTRHVRSISLDNTPHALAVAPKGEVLAVAYQGGIELHSLAPNCGDVDRRAVRSDRVDALTFSNDGTMLLGTNRNNLNPYTVILVAPYYAEDNQETEPVDLISHVWTSQIIFPHSSRDCSHAALLSSRSDGDASWTFTFDRVFESFRAVRTDDLRNGTTYFTGPKRSRRSNSTSSKNKLVPSTLPAPSQCGDLVATGFFGKDIWIYGIPQALDVPVTSQVDEPNGNISGPSTPISAPRSPTRSLSRGEASGLREMPRWEVLLDKHRNIFAQGKQVAEVPGTASLHWVAQEREGDLMSLRQRLIVAAPGGVAGDTDLEDEFATVDGGRLIILDFDRQPQVGSFEEITIDVGTDNPERLEEENLDIDTEVALARSRTRRDPRPLSTAAAALAPPTADIPPLPPNASAIADLQDAAEKPQETVVPVPPTVRSPNASSSPGLSVEEASAAFEGPYSHTNPRSRHSLYRSATAVAGHRERNAPRIVQDGVVEYRRPGDRRQLPHESDADNWVPPPPPYKPKADIPLPEHLQRTLLPKPTGLLSRPRTKLRRPTRASTMYEPNTGVSPQRDNIAGRRAQASEQRPQTALNSRSVSESLDQLSGPANISPLSDDFTPGNARPGLTSSPRRSSTTTSRRPVSAYFGRMTRSLRRSSNSELRRASEAQAPPVPSVPARLSHTPASPSNDSNSLSSPQTSPTPDQHDIPTIPSLPSAEQLANLSARSRAPPPQATQRNRTGPLTVITSGDRIAAPPRGALGAAGSPSSALLRSPSPTSASTSQQPYSPHQRFSSSHQYQQFQQQQQQQRPPHHRHGNSSPSFSSNLLLNTTTTTITANGVNSVNGGASGGNVTNPAAARSSPSLLTRPQAQRLDTIESIGSSTRGNSISVSRSRSARGGEGGRRSQSVGPALRLDRVRTGGGGGAGNMDGGRDGGEVGVYGGGVEREGDRKRRGFLGLGKGRRKGREREVGRGWEGEGGVRGGQGDRDGKCRVM